MSNFVRTKPTEVKPTKHSTVIGEILMFSKNKAQKLTTIDQKINEFEPYDFSNVKIKAMKEGEMKGQKMKIS